MELVQQSPKVAPVHDAVAVRVRATHHVAHLLVGHRAYLVLAEVQHERAHERTRVDRGLGAAHGVECKVDVGVG